MNGWTPSPVPAEYGDGVHGCSAGGKLQLFIGRIVHERALNGHARLLEIALASDRASASNHEEGSGRAGPSEAAQDTREGAFVSTHSLGDKTTTLDSNAYGNSNSNSSKAGSEIRVVIGIDAQRSQHLRPWLQVRGARRLLAPGVAVWVSAEEGSAVGPGATVVARSGEPSSQFEESISCWATSLRIIGAIPSTPYLARLLSMPARALESIFGQQGESGGAVANRQQAGQINLDDDADVRLAEALRPCSVTRCEELRRLCAAEKAKGRSSVLFKHKLLLQLCEDMRSAQGWSRRRRAAPTTRPSTWASLLRMELMWCKSDAVDGPEPTSEDCLPNDGRGSADAVDWESMGLATPRSDEIFDDPHAAVSARGTTGDGTAVSATSSMVSTTSMAAPPPYKQTRVTYAGIDVDPLLNIPNPEDARRVAYVDERKRPQVVWMLKLICRLVGLNAGCDPGAAVPLDHQDSSKPCVLRTTEMSPPPAMPKRRRLHLVDIGGGRGDLANAVAAFVSQPSIQARVEAHVTVVDVNAPSLEAGRERALQAGLGETMSFVLCDVSNADAVRNLAQGAHLPWNRRNAGPSDQQPTSGIDAVFGLHCCGGLSEAAVELAVACAAAFCVCTCCFCSHPHLATLSRRADKMFAKKAVADPMAISQQPLMASGSDAQSPTGVLDGDQAELLQQMREKHKSDREALGPLAVSVGMQGQHRAMRALNAMRLAAAEEAFDETWLSKSTPGSVSYESTSAADLPCAILERQRRSRLKTWQESFPVFFSVQNRVLVGCVEDAVPENSSDGVGTI